MNTNTIGKRIKKMFKTLKKEKERCRKVYIDWEDDCFNSLDCKFIWGIPEKETEKEPSFCSLNKAQVYYNRKTKRYYLDIDCGFYQCNDEKSARHELERLAEIDQGFRVFLIENNLKLCSKIPCFMSPDFQLELDGESLTELYTKFRIVLEGYRWFREQTQYKIANEKPQN